MIDTTTVELELDNVMNKDEQRVMLMFARMMKGKTAEERVAILCSAILEHAAISKTDMHDVMSVNSSVFHTFVMQAPDGRSKTAYIDECVDILQTLKPVSAKTKH